MRSGTFNLRRADDGAGRYDSVEDSGTDSGDSEKRQLSVIYITHDLGVVAKVADYVNVMYAGKIVESGTVEDVFYDPRHPYTWGLLSAMPDLGTDDERLYTIPAARQTCFTR